MQEQLQEDLKKKRTEALQQLKENGEEIAQMEQEIFEVGRNLKKGLEENHKFEQVSTVDFHDTPEVMSLFRYR